MAIAFDASAPAAVDFNGGLSPFQGSTAAFTPPAGALLWVIVEADDNAGACTTTLSDNKGGTWTRKARQNVGTCNDMYYRTATAGDSGLVITCTVSGGWNKANDAKITTLVVTGAAADQSTGATAAATAVNTLAITPTVVGSWVVGSWSDDTKGGTTLVANAATTILSQTNAGAGTFTNCSFRATSAATALTATTYGFTTATTGGRDMLLAEIVPASAGTNYTSSPADAEGITDAPSAIVGAVRTQGDPVGVTDAVTASLVAAGSAAPADPVGITDNVSAALSVVLTATVGDTVGITDTGAPQQLDLTHPVADAEGITDSVTASLATSGGSAVSDPVGLTDQAAAAIGAARSQADAVGLTDAVLAQLDRVATVSDLLGLTDAASPALASSSAQTIGDPEGITDATTSALSAARPLSDPVGLSDSAVAVLDRVATIADVLAVTDAAAAVNPSGFRDVTVRTGPTLARTTAGPTLQRTTAGPSLARTVPGPTTD